MTDGLINNYEGRVIICLILAFLGLIAAFVFALVFGLRKGAPLTTQVDQMTGVKNHGIGWWFLAPAAVTVGLPVLALIIVTGFEATHWAADNIAVVAFAAFVVAMLVAAGLGIRANHRARPAPEPAPILPAPEPVVGWDMPPMERNWNER